MKTCIEWVKRIVAGVAFVAAAAALPAASPPSGGTVAIQPQGVNGSSDPAMPSFVDAASASLTDKGFLILDDPAHAAYLAELTLERGDVGTALGKGSGGPSASIAGAGVIVALPSGKTNVVALVRTRLALRIRKRASGEILWDGAAVTIRQAGTVKGSESAVARDLSGALLSNYPAQSNASIAVP